MKVFQTNDIRNISLIGGQGSGKTTLAECLLFEGGVIERRGTVEAKNTTSDYRPIEHERSNSIVATQLYTEFNGKKINFIDTPGFDDFVGEVICAMRVTEVSLLLIHGNNGIEVGTELSWRNAAKYNQPVVLVVNHLDHEKSEFDEIIKASKDFFGTKVVQVQYPLNSGKEFNSIIDVLTMKMYKYSSSGSKPEVLSIPESEMEKADELHNILVEAAAENDEVLMELFFEKGSLTADEMRKGIKDGLMKRTLFPVFCVAAKGNIGVSRLMEFVVNVVPNPSENPELSTENEVINCDSSKPFLGFVYKTSFEEHLGEVSFIKVCSGTVTEGMDCENSKTESKERISQMFAIAGKKREKIEKVMAGDIFATIKLKNTNTNSTLGAKGFNYIIKPTSFPEPKFRTAIKALATADDEKLASILLKMNSADPTLIFEYSKELKQMLIHGQGELHINIAKWHLENEYKIATEYLPPRIPYRETITKQTLSDYRHRKQSGGAGQFGEVFLMIEPFEPGMPDPPSDKYSIRGREEISLNWGGKLVYFNAIVGGAIDARFLPAILKGIMEKMEEGPLTGSYARDIRVTVYDGKMHPVDSNEISFKLAGRNAFTKGFKSAGPKLLEPIYLVEVIVPEERMGDVITDLQGRRGMILGMEGQGIYQKINARVPLGEMNKYSTSLSSLTNGRASYTMKFADYQQVPPDVQDKLLKEYEESKKEED